MSSGFQRDRLPGAAAYFADEGLKIVGRGEWRSATCPFHEDRNPSLRVRLETGSFKCMSCGAKGHDILAFHRQRYGQSFKEAAMALGAWGEE